MNKRLRKKKRVGEFRELGFEIVSTKGTAEELAKSFIPARAVPKLHEGGRDIVELLAKGGIDIVVNTPSGSKDASEDDSYIRKEAIRARIPYFTTMRAAQAAALGMKEMMAGEKGGIKSLQEYHKAING